ncbi:putative pentatricopeptide repeat-containing protein At5g08490 [Nymphaea colorata]|nr:putative pentatricopeptide repeat-containing protein At5g08490 [Nymphaea colorata]
MCIGYQTGTRTLANRFSIFFRSLNRWDSSCPFCSLNLPISTATASSFNPECTNHVAPNSDRFHVNLSYRIADDRFIQKKPVLPDSRRGCLWKAIDVFDEVDSADQESWNLVIRKCTVNGDFEATVKFFVRMVEEGFQPDECSFLDILKACSFLSFLELGRKSHASIVKSGYGHIKLVSNALVNMYARSQGGIGYARQLFDEMSDRDSVTWNVMISGFVHSKSYRTSLEFFCLMTIGRERPNAITFAIIFPVCVQLGSFSTGLCIHGLAIRMGLVSKTLVGNALVSMYAKFGRSVDACYLFDEILEKDVVSWNATIAGLCENNQYVEARNLFSAMVFRGYMPNSATIVNVLPICGLLQDRDHGRQIHCYLLRASLDTDVYVSNALLTFYSRVGNMMKAEYIFQMMDKRDLVSWNTMVVGYTTNGQFLWAINCFNELLSSQFRPDSVTIISILPTCAQLLGLKEGKKIHRYVLRRPEMQTDLHVRNALISFYGKCGEPQDAYGVFLETNNRDVVSWNAMLSAYSQIGQGDKIVELLHQMHIDGIKPDHVTILNILSAHASVGMRRGKQLHGYCIRTELMKELSVENALLCMYAKHRNIIYASNLFTNLSRKKMVLGDTTLSGNVIDGSQGSAGRIFNQMCQRDLTICNLMIQVYAQNNCINQALNLFIELNIHGMKPDAISFMSLLPVCAHLASTRLVRQCHGFIVRSCFNDVCLDGALLDVYAKCGNIQVASKLFNNSSQPDLVMFTAMIGGLAMHGRSEEAVKIFDQMLQSEIKPDHVAMTAILSACSHGGLLDKGRKYFESMSDAFGIEPTIEHYACMADLLARSGCLKEAYEFVSNMPCEANANVWGTLLGACKMHHNVALGQVAGYHLFNVEAGNIGNYVLLSNIYAADRRWDRVEELRKMMKQKDLKKPAGCSWIEVKQKLHIFISGDSSHPERCFIYNMLRTLDQQIKEPLEWISTQG